MTKMIIQSDEAYPVFDLKELPDYTVHPNHRAPVVDITDEFKQRFDKVMEEYSQLQAELAEIMHKAEYVNVLDVQKQVRKG